MSSRNVVITSAGLRALQDHAMPRVANQVLWHLVNELPPNGEIVSKAALEEKLSITRPQLSNTIKYLCQAGFLARGARHGLSYHYKPNPVFFRILA
jgi:DNA-binding MarR family transcriptional regulator